MDFLYIDVVRLMGTSYRNEWIYGHACAHCHRGCNVVIDGNSKLYRKVCASMRGDFIKCGSPQNKLTARCTNALCPKAFAAPNAMMGQSRKTTHAPSGPMFRKSGARRLITHVQRARRGPGRRKEVDIGGIRRLRSGAFAFTVARFAYWGNFEFHLLYVSFILLSSRIGTSGYLLGDSVASLF